MSATVMPQVAVFVKTACSWPKERDRATRGQSCSLQEILDTAYNFEACFTAYSSEDKPGYRLSSDAAGVVDVKMEYLVIDVDNAEAKKSGALVTRRWLSEEAKKIRSVIPMPVIYITPHGYRAIAKLSTPFAISSKLEAEKWKKNYIAFCDKLKQYGVDADKSAADWTRIWRVPCYVSKDRDTRMTEVYGSVETMSNVDIENSPKDKKLSRLDELIEDVENAVEGERHATLISRATSVANIVKRDKRINEQSAKERLLVAGLNSGLPESEVTRCIDDAFKFAEKDASDFAAKNVSSEDDAEVETSGVRNSYDVTEPGVAKRFIVENKGKYVCCGGNWYTYSTNVWREISEETMCCEVAKFVDDYKCDIMLDGSLDEKTKKSLVKRLDVIKGASKSRGVLVYLRGDPEVIVDADKFNRELHVVGAKNCYVNLRDGSTTSGDAKSYVTKRVNVRYDKNAKCPLWIKFLNDTFESQEMIDFVQRLLGYIMTGETSEHKMFFFYGNGCNGKTTLIEVISSIMAGYAEPVNFESFTERRNGAVASGDLARLRETRLAYSSEGNGDTLNEGIVKRITGGDMLLARQLYKNEIKFTPRFKVVVCTNNKPRIRGGDEGIWRRIVCVPFARTVARENIDYELKQKLISESEGIFAWIVEGAKTWYANKLVIPKSIIDESAEFKLESSQLSHFLEEKCEHATTEEEWESSTKVYGAYVAWCKETSEFAVNRVKFKEEILRLGVKYKKERILRKLSVKLIF